MKFSILDSSGRRLLADFRLDVTERKRAEDAVRASEQSIRRLYEITNAAELSFDERVRALLAFGCQRYGTPNGLVTQACGDELEVRYSHSPDGSFREGMKIPRSAAYCNSVMTADEPLCYEHIGQSVWREHPGYLALGMECYVGTKVLVDGRVYGTLCFLGASPHDETFNDSDKDFLKLMAVWISGELDRHQAHPQLQKSHDQIRQSEEQYRVTFDQAAVGVAHVGLDGRWLRLNRKLCEITGYAKEELLQLRFQDIIHPDDLQPNLDFTLHRWPARSRLSRWHRSD